MATRITLRRSSSENSDILLLLLPVSSPLGYAFPTPETTFQDKDDNANTAHVASPLAFAESRMIVNDNGAKSFAATTPQGMQADAARPHVDDVDTAASATGVFHPETATGERVLEQEVRSPTPS